MKKGDRVRNKSGWQAKVTSTRGKNILVRWLTGPIRGHEARLEKSALKVLSAQKRFVIRNGRRVEL